jgi:hypothetical protein
MEVPENRYCSERFFSNGEFPNETDTTIINTKNPHVHNMYRFCSSLVGLEVKSNIFEN